MQYNGPSVGAGELAQLQQAGGSFSQASAQLADNDSQDNDLTTFAYDEPAPSGSPTPIASADTAAADTQSQVFNANQISLLASISQLHALGLSGSTPKTVSFGNAAGMPNNLLGTGLSESEAGAFAALSYSFGRNSDGSINLSTQNGKQYEVSFGADESKGPG